jgi:CheY-like chemotaxis protein
MKTVHILFVEDDPLNQLLIRETIKGSSYTYEILANGNEAFEKIKKEKYDIVFLDINIPGMNGYILAQSIRATSQDNLKNISLIAMSASSLDQSKVRDFGINDFIDKPFTIEELTSKISEHLKQENFEVTPRNEETKINEDHLTRISKGNEHMLKNMMSIFIKQKEEAFVNFEKGLLTKDWEKIELTAHNLKSSASLIGADHIYELVDSIEQLASAKEKFESLNGLINQAKKYLDSSIQKIGITYNL